MLLRGIVGAGQPVQDLGMVLSSVSNIPAYVQPVHCVFRGDGNFASQVSFIVIM
jgi:hypothetical protein